MTSTPQSATPHPADSARSVRNSIVALVVTAAVAFTIVGAVAVFTARRIAREDSLAEAVQRATVLGSAAFSVDLPAALHGDVAARDRLDLVAERVRQAGSVVRVKVWTEAGKIVYCDDHSQIGLRFPENTDARAIAAGHHAMADVSDLKDPENRSEAGEFDWLLEVYVPLKLSDGTKVAFELYTTGVRLRDTQNRITGEIVPAALAGLALLVLLQLPVAVWLVRRVGRAQQERARLLANSLAASLRERREIARDLHDGVIQDLAGVGYVLGAAERRISTEEGPAEVRPMLSSSGDAVHRAVRDLRSLAIAIRPPELTSEGVARALDELAERLTTAHGFDARMAVMLPHDVSPDILATVYRCARESLTNVVKHAAASEVVLVAGADDSTVSLTVTDDGRGLPPGGLPDPSDGHVGLALLGDAARDLGGVLTVGPGELGGTRVSLVLPRRDGKHR